MKNIDNYIIKLNQLDNVATVIKNISPNSYYFNGNVIRIKQGIKKGFKISVRSILKGNKIYKYGQPIGTALVDIKPGEVVHIHNIKSLVYYIY